LALQVEPCVAIYNQHLELIFLLMYKAVDSSEKKLQLKNDIFIAILGCLSDLALNVHGTLVHLRAVIRIIL
jgi:hypothetical protein